MKRLSVAVRQKKNVSGKCDGEIIVTVMSQLRNDSANN